MLSKNCKSIEVDLSYENLPDCVEKYLAKLMFLLLENEEGFHYQININFSHFTKLFGNPENKSLKNLEKLIDEQINWTQAYKVAKQLFSEIKVINTSHIYEMLKVANENKDHLHNKDVIIFLGETGVGKSTTIHYLAGSQLDLKKIYLTSSAYILSYQPESQNPQLQNVVVSSQAKSETRYVTPVHVNLKDIGSALDIDVYLCDTPGFGDTAGVEQDIANMFQLLESIKTVSTLRPVIIIGKNSLGEKGQNFKATLKLLTRMINGINPQILQSFSYIFTKFDEMDNILGSLKSIETENQNLNELEKLLLKDMIQKVQDFDVKLIIKQKKKPSEILEKILSKPPIKNQNIFNPTLSENAISILNQFSNQQMEKIREQAKRNQWDLVKYSLDELYYIDCLMAGKHDMIHQKYGESIDRVIEILNEKVKNSADQIINKLKIHQQINDYDLKLFQENEKILAKSQKVMQHLQNKSEQLENTTSLIIQEVLQCSQKFISLEEIEDLSNFKMHQENLNLLSQLSEDVKKSYLKGQTICQNHLEHIMKEVSDLLKKNEYNKIAEKIDQIQQCKTFFEERFHQKIDKQKYKFTQDLISHLKGIESKTINLIQMNEINQENFNQIVLNYQIFQTIQNNKILNSLIQENIQNSIIQIENQFRKKFNILNQSIQKSLQNEEEQQIQLYLQQIEIFRSNESISFLCQKNYAETIETLTKYATDVQKLIIKELNNAYFESECQDIKRRILKLKDLDWINRYQSSCTNQVRLNIAEAIEIKTKNLQEEFEMNYKNLENLTSLENLDSFKQASQIIKCLQNLQELKQDQNSIIEIIQNCKKSLLLIINNTINKIKEHYKQYDDYFKQIQIKEEQQIKPKKIQKQSFFSKFLCCGGKSNQREKTQEQFVRNLLEQSPKERMKIDINFADMNQQFLEYFKSSEYVSEIQNLSQTTSKLEQIFKLYFEQLKNEFKENLSGLTEKINNINEQFNSKELVNNLLANLMDILSLKNKASFCSYFDQELTKLIEEFDMFQKETKDKMLKSETNLKNLSIISSTLMVFDKHNFGGNTFYQIYQQLQKKYLKQSDEKFIELIEKLEQEQFQQLKSFFQEQYNLDEDDKIMIQCIVLLKLFEYFSTKYFKDMFIQSIV